MENGPVTRAAAEISLKGALYVLHAGLGVIPEQGVHRHDDARRAEAALGAMGLGQSLL